MRHTCPKDASKQVSVLTEQVRRHLHPLDGTVHVSANAHETAEHFVSIVPTYFRGVDHVPVETYQVSRPNQKIHESGHGRSALAMVAISTDSGACHSHAPPCSTAPIH